MISKFVGALTAKAQEFYGSFTTIVGMIESIDQPHESINSIETTPGAGAFEVMHLPIGVLFKLFGMNLNQLKKKQAERIPTSQLIISDSDGQ